MRTDKQAAKGTGGFFNLFDWNVKYRKKLFSSKSDLPERLKQGKKSDVNLPMTRLHLMDDNETGAGSSNKGSSDYSCASSVTEDEGYGSKAPGVVARLMGLDSLPTSNEIEPYSSPFFDSQIKDSHQLRKNYDVHHDHQLLHSGNLPHKVEGPTRKIMESKPQRFSNRPIEKFQTEVLPPKSAKSIPITQHKMLSPIKNPGFIPAKNAAHIMEAAAKIIDQGSQTTTRAKVSHAVPSVTLKIRDPKAKLEASSRASRLGETSRRPAESNSAKYLKGQSLNKSWSGSVDTSFRVFSDADENSDRLKTKVKSISLAIQAKVNVQRREGLNQSSCKSLVGRREQNESNIQKNINKCSIRDTTSVLRQNDQKQNCLDKDRVSPKPSVSNWQARKAVSRDSSVGRNKNISKITSTYKGRSKKLGVEVTTSDRGVSYSKPKSLTCKKRSVDGDFQFQKNRAVDDNSLINNGENPGTDGRYKCAEESSKKGMDIISFTFTAPMTRSISGTESTNQEATGNNSLFSEHEGKNKLDDKDRTKLSSFGFNVIGSNDLSVLLEQKLMELTSGNKSSQSNSTAVGKSESLLHDMVPRLHDKRDYLGHRVDKLGNRFDYDLSSIESSKCQTRHKFQGMEEEMVEHSEGPVEARHPSPISILEPITTESCNSSDSAVSHSTEGSRHCSSVQAQDVVDLGSSKKFHLVETDTELSDSASSTSARKMAWETAVLFTAKDHDRSTEWELAYVEEILCDVELMFKDFTSGRAREIVNPHLFYKLENRKGLFNGDLSRIRRKELFDGVSECLDLKCRRYVGGGFGLWEKGMMMVRRNKWLADEVYKEICGWRRMCDCIVDELVDKDMSSQHGRWLDFEVEAFVVGADIRDQILRSLVDEVVADLLYS